MIRLGLWFYDHLAPRDFLSGSAAVDLSQSPLGQPLHRQWRQGFVYTDGWVDDARLVLLCALDAVEQGAHVLPRTRCEALHAYGGGWRATLVRRDALTDQATRTLTVQARAVVNAAGPWAEQLLRRDMGVPAVAPGGRQGATQAAHLRLVKGSHIVVPRLFEHDHAYLLQGEDRRVVFAIPYERDFTLIGTTDVDHPGRPGRRARERGRSALPVRRRGTRSCAARSPLRTWCGVRRCAPLAYDAQVPPPRSPARLPPGDADACPRLADRVGRQADHLPRAGRAGGRSGRHPAGRPALPLDHRGLLARRPAAVRQRHRPDPCVAGGADDGLSGAPAPAAPLDGPGPGAALEPRLRQPDRPSCSMAFTAAPTWAPRWPRPGTRPSCSTCAATNGRSPLTTCCGAEPSWACATAPAQRQAVADWLAAQG